MRRKVLTKESSVPADAVLIFALTTHKNDGAQMRIIMNARSVTGNSIAKWVKSVSMR